jgi:hypothetical protein
VSDGDHLELRDPLEHPQDPLASKQIVFADDDPDRRARLRPRAACDRCRVSGIEARAVLHVVS